MLSPPISAFSSRPILIDFLFNLRFRPPFFSTFRGNRLAFGKPQKIQQILEKIQQNLSRNSAKPSKIQWTQRNPAKTQQNSWSRRKNSATPRKSRKNPTKVNKIQQNLSKTSEKQIKPRKNSANSAPLSKPPQNRAKLIMTLSQASVYDRIIDGAPKWECIMEYAVYADHVSP